MKKNYILHSILGLFLFLNSINLNAQNVNTIDLAELYSNNFSSGNIPQSIAELHALNDINTINSELEDIKILPKEEVQKLSLDKKLIAKAKALQSKLMAKYRSAKAWTIQNPKKAAAITAATIVTLATIIATIYALKRKTKAPTPSSGSKEKPEPSQEEEQKRKEEAAKKAEEERLEEERKRKEEEDRKKAEAATQQAKVQQQEPTKVAIFGETVTLKKTPEPTAKPLPKATSVAGILMQQVNKFAPKVQETAKEKVVTGGKKQNIEEEDWETESETPEMKAFLAQQQRAKEEANKDKAAKIAADKKLEDERKAQQAAEQALLQGKPAATTQPQAAQQGSTPPPLPPRDDKPQGVKGLTKMFENKPVSVLQPQSKQHHQNQKSLGVHKPAGTITPA